MYRNAQGTEINVAMEVPGYDCQTWMGNFSAFSGFLSLLSSLDGRASQRSAPKLHKGGCVVCTKFHRFQVGPTPWQWRYCGDRWCPFFAGIDKRSANPHFAASSWTSSSFFFWWGRGKYGKAWKPLDIVSALKLSKNHNDGWFALAFWIFFRYAWVPKGIWPCCFGRTFRSCCFRHRP